MSGEEDRIGAQGDRDRTRRTYEGNRGRGVHHHEGGGRHQPAEQVDAQIPEVSEGLLHIVAKDPQKPHVENDMGHAAVEEHRREESQKHVLVGNGRRLGSGSAHVADDLLDAQRGAGCHFTGNCGPLIEEYLLILDRALLLHQEEDAEIDGDEKECHPGCDPGRVDIAQWKQRRSSRRALSR